MQWEEVSNLALFLKKDGDVVLDGKCKLSLTSSILHKLNNSFINILNNEDLFTSSFHVLNSTGDMLDTFLDLHFLYDFFQKTVGLKLIPSSGRSDQFLADIQVFRNLRLLEIQRLSLTFVKGIKNLRAQLEYLTCMRSLNALKEVLESCGGDKSQGFIWSELKEATFCHNSLSNVDGSFEFTPRLESLDLSHNFIENIQQINCLSNLKYLNLSFNKIKTVPPFTGGICDTLQVLILRHNFINDIKELSVLVKLKQLDLAYNLLIDHEILIPLANMADLVNLYLQGNPLCCHPSHRLYTVRYLHSNVVKNKLKLDYCQLSRKEVRLVGCLQSMLPPIERSSSFNSVTTANTVIQITDPHKLFTRQRTFLENNQTSDMETSSTSAISQTSEERQLRQQARNNLFQDGNISIQDSQGMQDSGIVARPPSECSVGSATSMHIDPEYRLKYSESDIEVLSNPSQSSIEVLATESTHRYIQSGNTASENDLNCINEEIQRSL